MQVHEANKQTNLSMTRNLKYKKKRQKSLPVEQFVNFYRNVSHRSKHFGVSLIKRRKFDKGKEKSSQLFTAKDKPNKRFVLTEQGKTAWGQ